MTELSSSRDCLVCGGSASHVLYKSTINIEKSSSPRNYIPTYNLALQHGELSVCDGCGFIFVSDQPPPEVYASVYSNMEDATYLTEVSGYRASFELLLKQLEPQKSQGNDLLEVGCGAGFFLDEARKHGWNIQGIELSKWMASQAQTMLGPGVVTQGGYESKPSKTLFDVVVAIHVVEHVPDPAHFLTTLHGLLKPGGLLCLVTPNIESLVAKVTGEKWWYIQIPHIYYFTPKSLGRLMDKCGFPSARFISYPRFITDSMVANRIDFLPKFLRPLARVVLWPFLRFSWTMRLDLGDQVIALAKRPA